MMQLLTTRARLQLKDRDNWNLILEIVCRKIFRLVLGLAILCSVARLALFDSSLFEKDQKTDHPKKYTM